jgi:hypothetical protein
LAQVSESSDPYTFVEAPGHPDWDTIMNEEYRSLVANNTWDLVPLPKGRKLSDVNGSIELSMDHMEVLKGTRLNYFPKDFPKLKEFTIMELFPL